MSETTTQPLLDVQNVDVAFGQQPVLKSIRLSIPRGQTLAVIGESGCGKTVLLKTMIGLIRPQQGRVTIDGRDLHSMTERQLTQERIRYGFVFQQAALFDSLTIGQNVAFPLRQHTTKPRDEIRQIVLDRLEEVGLPDLVLHKKPAELSGGMRKRVGLARALALDPDIVLYDEPTTGLDPIMSDVINELILRTSSRARVTSVVVTHDMTSAMKVADRIVMLYPSGRLRSGECQTIFDGTPDELRSASERRVQQFFHGEAGERLMELRQESSQRNSVAEN
jgi:phospholipid/cholesterol/gamma-HCH transport system ATP-binding protein